MERRWMIEVCVGLVRFDLVWFGLVSTAVGEEVAGGKQAQHAGTRWTGVSQ